MSNTRFNNDNCRIEKQLEIMTNPGRYMLDVPGNDGAYPAYVEDPMIRIQKWGANFRTNGIDIESELKGILNPLGKDCIKTDKKTVSSAAIQYPNCSKLTTGQPRASMPAWTTREIESFIDDKVLFLNPQENVAFAFQNNICTRILEKDFFQNK